MRDLKPSSSPSPPQKQAIWCLAPCTPAQQRKRWIAWWMSFRPSNKPKSACSQRQPGGRSHQTLCRRLNPLPALRPRDGPGNHGQHPSLGEPDSRRQTAQITCSCKPPANTACKPRPRLANLVDGGQGAAKPSANQQPDELMRSPEGPDGSASLHHLQRPPRQGKKPQAQGRRSRQRQRLRQRGILALSLKADSGGSEKIQRPQLVAGESTRGQRKAVFASQIQPASAGC